ncbi:hypothetical protein AU255_03820 [Methyloprofundus sedimenti]|uniref:Polymerase beta nucleotidyltransferase domain-containing protein n=1 Tax=Methyloprofundus sedimenti TaxID=1420851 RepID=A0A1V8M650_9GAMM|nr:nucleotidyltransferase domain-containing protein [Methyloprofundus sedimenti]OQK17035.1 hypothetical protein AU255_03820 [Methyloprofundus sedimenti]
MDLIELESVLKHWLSEHTEIELAILFGSYAKGTATDHSDIDFAIKLSSRQGIKAGDKLAYIQQLSILLSRDIDLIDLRSVGQPLLAQIIKYGKRLLGSDADYAQLAINNINSIQDFTPYIERMLTERRKRWLVNG